MPRRLLPSMEGSRRFSAAQDSQRQQSGPWPPSWLLRPSEIVRALHPESGAPDCRRACSRPFSRLADVILLAGWSPANSMTWRNMLSRSRRVAIERFVHAVVSRYRAINQLKLPAASTLHALGFAAYGSFILRVKFRRPKCRHSYPRALADADVPYDFAVAVDFAEQMRRPSSGHRLKNDLSRFGVNYRAGLCCSLRLHRNGGRCTVPKVYGDLAGAMLRRRLQYAVNDTCCGLRPIGHLLCKSVV